MNLNLFIRNCFPGWENIFTITNDIMLDLSINDQNFYEHLKSISNVRKNINYKVCDSYFLFLLKISLIILTFCL